MNTITVPVKVSTDALAFSVDVSADRAFAVGLDTAVKPIESEHYSGPYEVEPSAEQKILPTAGYFMEYDVVVSAIPEQYGLITWDGSTLTVS